MRFCTGSHPALRNACSYQHPRREAASSTAGLKMQNSVAGMSEHWAQCGEWYMCPCDTSRRRCPGTHYLLCCSNTFNRPFSSITDSVTDLCWRERVPQLQRKRYRWCNIPNVPLDCVPLVTSRNIVATGSESKCNRANASTTALTTASSSSVDVIMTNSRYARLLICVNCF